MQRIISLRPRAAPLASRMQVSKTTPILPQTRAFHRSAFLSKGLNQRVPDEPSAVDDTLADSDARGRTGGGKPLEKGTNPPARPKISNASVPGDDTESLTEEQQREVDEHNREFEKKHDRAAPAADDKVDKKFWAGVGGSK